MHEAKGAPHLGFPSPSGSKATGFGSEPKPNRSSSVFLEDPKDSNPRFRAFFFRVLEPVELQAASF